MPRIIAGAQFLDATLPDGTTPNPIRAEVVTLALKALFQQALDAVEIPIEHGEYPASKLVAILDAGGEILDYPVWLELTDAQLASNVPAFVPGATNQGGQPVTWAQWCAPANQPIKYGNRWYIGTNYRDGVDLPGSIVRQLQQAGATIRLASAMQQIIEANS